MKVINGDKQLFTDHELLEIENLWGLNEIKSTENLDKRSYRFCAINNELSNTVSTRLIEWFNSLELKDTIITKPSNLLIHEYTTGNYFDKHTDNQVIGGSLRRYLIGITLPSQYTGGEFITYDNDRVVLGEIPGVPYVMESTVLHEVLPILDGVRKTAFIFIFDKHLKKISSI